MRVIDKHLRLITVLIELERKFFCAFGNKRSVRYISAVSHLTASFEVDVLRTRVMRISVVLYHTVMFFKACRILYLVKYLLRRFC